MTSRAWSGRRCTSRSTDVAKPLAHECWRLPGALGLHGSRRRLGRAPHHEGLRSRRETRPHPEDGRTYVYHAAEERARVAAGAVQRIVDWFCNGSMEEVLAGMVDNAMLDQQQLRALADQVAKAKKARGVKKE